MVIIFSMVIFSTFAVYSSYRIAESLKTAEGRTNYFNKYLKPIASQQLRDSLVLIMDTAALQQAAVDFGERVAEGQFFVDHISGRIVANKRSIYIGYTNKDIGGEVNGPLWQKAFNRVKSEALKSPGKIFSISYFEETEKENDRVGIAYYDPERQLIFGRVYDELDFNELRANHMEGLYTLSLPSFMAILIGLLVFIYVFRQYSHKDKQYREYELALNTSDTAMALLDKNSRVTFANKVFKDLYQGKYLGKRLTEVSSYPKIREKFDKCVEEGTATYRNRGAASGKVITSSVVLTRYPSPKGWKVMMVITDVTEVVEAYRAVAHDMKNPLYAPQIEIDTALLELERGKLSKERIRAVLHAIHDRVVACESYALYLEAWGRNEVDCNLETSTPVDISKTIKMIAKLFNSSFQTHRIDAKFDLEPNLLLSTRRRSLEAIIRNLLTNAIGAFKQSSNRQITVAAYTNNNNIVIDVTDNAVGMTDKRKESLYSEDIDKIAGGARIVVFYTRKMGGEVFVKKSVLGQGTTVTLQIPIQ